MLGTFDTDGNRVFFGSKGYTIVTDTGVHDGPFIAISFLTDSVFATLKDGGAASEDSADITSVTFKAGTTIFNANGWVSASLTSGSFIGYRG